jgi:PAS domain S-box-containing protein
MVGRKRYTVLLVEDNEDHAFLVARSFAKSRDALELVLADSIQAAAAMLKAASPSIIICDYLLPDGTGLDLLHRQLRENPGVPPFILLTSQGDEKIAVEAMKAGATDYIVKTESSLLSLPDVCRAVIREHEQRKEKAQAVTELAEKQQLNETLLSALPYPAMLIRGEDRVIVAANKIAMTQGARIGDRCWSSFGRVMLGGQQDCDRDTCSICRGDRCMFGEPQNDPEVKVSGAVWDTYWIKVSDSLFLHYAVDVTERHKLQNELQNLIREQSTVLNTSIVGISKVVDRVMVWVNDAMCDIFGYERSELENTGTEMLYPCREEYLSLGDAAYAQLALGSGFSAETLMRRKDGSTLWVLLHGNAIDPLCPSAGTVWLFEDVTERKTLETHLRESQKMESIGQLAGGVAHDFNNLLTVIMGYCNLLEMDPELGPRQKEALSQIMASSEKAAQLTRGLLAFSRKQVMDPKRTDLNDIVHHVQKFLLRIIGEDIQFKLTVKESHLPVKVDSGQIEQVLINLATNARDAMPRGGLLSVETGLQQIDGRFQELNGDIPHGSYAVVTVTDTGMGMDDEVRAKIFEPFFTTKEVGQGTGLGMAIVHGIVKQHKGFIDVSSEPGAGTTFRIFLPIFAGSRDESESVMLALPEGGSEAVLLAEDDPSVRTLMSSWFESFGYQVMTATDGQEAVEQFAAYQEEIALIVMDVIMPRKNGQEAYEEIARLRPGVKILYLSGYTADFIKNRGVSEEGIEMMMKPVQPMELLRKVRQMLDGVP